MKKQIAALAIGLVSGTPALSLDGQAMAQTRYSTPPATTLSGDLASPWILQLRNKPSGNRAYSVTIRPAAPKVLPPLPEQKAVKRKKLPVISARPVPAPQPVSVERKPEVAKAAKPKIDPKFLPQVVSFETSEKPGTVIVDTSSRFLYLVMEGGKARRYGVGVGREGFEWSGSHRITRTAEWPDWRPPAEMIERERKKGKHLPAFMEGGPDNPLGARALYIGDTLYRIHGTNQPWSIGMAVSSGCIRMRNEDVIDLYERVRVGARVVVS